MAALRHSVSHCLYLRPDLQSSTWSEKQSLRRLDSGAGSVRLASADNRVALVAETCDHLFSLQRLDGSTFGTPAVLDPGADIYGLGPVSMDSTGSVLVTWTNNLRTRLHAAVRAADADEWTLLPSAPVPSQAYPIHALLDDAGRVTVVSQDQSLEFLLVQTLVGGDWTRTKLSLPSDDVFPYSISSEPGGTLAVVFVNSWHRHPAKVLAFVRPTSSSPFDSHVVSTTGNSHSYVDSAMSASGDLVVAWSDQPGKSGVPTLVERSPSGDWQGPVVLGGGSLHGSPAVSRHDDGSTVVSVDVPNADDALYRCDLGLVCAEVPFPPGMADAYMSQYVSGPDGSAVAVGAGRDGYDSRYRNLRASLLPGDVLDPSSG